MRILLDTCDFLWFISGDPSLPSKLHAPLRDSSNEVFLSVISFWEILVKNRLGKLPLPRPPERYIVEQCERHAISILNLDLAAVIRLPNLPLIHRDPFDRMLICQAQAGAMLFASSDPMIHRYAVELL